MNLLPSDTVFNHLKGRGLLLSPISKVELPKPQAPAQTFLGLISSFMVKKPAQKCNTTHLLPILNSAFILTTDNTMHLYKYKIGEKAYELMVDEQPQSVPLPSSILKLYTCENKYVQDRGDVPIAVQVISGLYVFVYDSKEMLLKEKQFFKVTQITGVSFFSQKEVAILSGHSHLSLYLVSSGVRKDSREIKLNIGNDEKLLQTWIFGNADEEQDTTIVIFYATKNGGNDNKIKLKVKQCVRTLDGGLEEHEKSDFEVPSANLENHQKLRMTNVGDYYCVQMPKEVLILKKKFDKYMFLDNMMEKLNQCSVHLNPKGLIVSVGPQLMELNCVHFSDPKCQSRICDIIQFQNEELSSNYQNFREIWPILIKKQYSLIFVFQKQNSLILTHLVKKEAMQKLLELAKKIQQAQLKGEVINAEGSLNVIQDMAKNMGISRKQFYFELWKYSHKQNSDIYKYLLPCHDISTIKRELKSTLRRRTIKVIEMNRILEKMHDIISESLKTDLNQGNLKEFLKNDFLRRKINLDLAQKDLDHRIFDTIYGKSLIDIFFDIIKEALFYEEVKTDPMNSMLDKVEKQNKSMEKVFQEFKVLLLEDYKQFLRDLFSLPKFEGEITTILAHYPFLLPNFPCKIEVQRPSKINQPVRKDLRQKNDGQPVWFQVVTLQEWEHELTKQRIMKFLHHDYPTSKLNETIDQFVTRERQRKQKNEKKDKVEKKKHGLISLSLDEFIQKVEELNGINLYLDICEFANTEAIRLQKPENSREILKILEKNNKLSGQMLEECKLYATMHYFMLKNEISCKKPLKIHTLRNLSEENLLALFFLENKQRKQLIFTEFMDLYEDKQKFINLLAKFVKSENCSRIQLQILMKEMIDRGHEFQKKNQQIIELLIMGVCTKLEIRESLLILDSDEQQEEAQTLIDQIDVGKDLALKISRIKQLKKCRDIFINFKCEKMTYQQLVSLEKNNQIFKMLLEKYFMNDYKSEELSLQGEEIHLNSPTSLLTIMLYLQENVFYNLEVKDLLLQYGLFLIEWKEFDSIRELLYDDEQLLKALEIDPLKYASELIHNALQLIYMDPEIVYDEETRTQILKILSIIDGQHEIKTREIAKLNLVDIFEKWGTDIHPADIQSICSEWQHYTGKLDFINRILGNFSGKLTFQIFKDVYDQLQITTHHEKDPYTVDTDYIQFLILYVEKLLKEERYPEVIEILSYIKGLNLPHNSFISFSLLSEAFLKSLIRIHQDDEEGGRRMIDFFVENNNPQNDIRIRNLFQSNFDEAELSVWQRETQIYMNEKYFYKGAKGKSVFNLNDLWQMAKEESKTTSEVFYNYYFLATGLRNPKQCFGSIHGISYNLEQITDLVLNKLEMFISLNKKFWIINYDELLKAFKLGLTDQAKSRLPEVHLQADVKLERVLDSLKEDREKNFQLIKCLTRVKQQWKSKMKKEERKNRFINFMEELKREQEQRRRKGQIKEVIQEPIDKYQEEKVFMKWKLVDKEMLHFSQTQRSFATDREMISHIYDSFVQEDPRRRRKQINHAPSPLQPVLPLMASNEDVRPIAQMIYQQDYENVANNPVQVVRAAFDLFLRENPEIEEQKAVQIIDKLHIGDENKITMRRLAKIFRQTIGDEDISKLFPIESILQPINYSEQEKYDVIYKQLKPVLQELVKKGTSAYIKQLAKIFRGFLDSAQYSAWVYYETLIYIGGNLEFISDSALLSQDCIMGLKEYPQIIPNNYKQLLNSFQKDKEMRLYVRENLAKIMTEKGMLDVAEEIRNL